MDIIIIESFPTVEDKVRDYSMGKSLKPNEDNVKAEISTTRRITQRSLEVNKKLAMMDDATKL